MVSKFLLALLILGGALTAAPVLAAELVKTAGDPAVYYLDDNQVRHIFPTAATYFTWYNDFANIRELPAEEIRQYPLGFNITIRPGVNLVSFKTGREVYAVETGGVLRPFKDQAVIGQIYGSRWTERVIALPDAFFNDYTVGERITSDYNLPDGAVYRYAGKYYFKHQGLAWPFADRKDVLANKFKSADILESAIGFNERQTPITGLNRRVYNPVALPRLANADCANRRLKAAIVLVANGGYQQQELAKLEQIAARLEENFVWATNELAEIEVAPTITVIDTQLALFKDEDGQLKPDNEAINLFYDRAEDVYDFIILYNNFVADEPLIAKYFMVTNNFFGTGNAERDTAYLFGSGGKLKGIANMGNLAKYGDDSRESLDQTVNYILHELGHHWSGRAMFRDTAGQNSAALLDGKDHLHWSHYLDFASPLGGAGWQDNGDGTFTSRLSLTNDNRRRYSELDLYLMGLLPHQAVDKIKYLVPADPAASGNTIAGRLAEVDISQIIEVMGKVNCRL